MIKFLILFFIPSYLFASALVFRDEKKMELQLISRLNYWGAVATPEIAEAATKEISTLWNEPEVYVTMNEKQYRIRFIIDHKFHGKNEPNVGLSCAQNTIEIRKKRFADDRSFYISSRGAFYLHDDIGNSTTAAHEYGHGLMLDHPHSEDQRDAEIPGIMFARGTWVKSEFQWNPTHKAGLGDGILNPKYRRVRVEDVKSIPLHRIFLFNNYACLGKGNPIPLQPLN